jgi:hypothetical protein
MADKKRDSIKSLIQNVELDKPCHNFTDMVMEEVMTQNEPVISPVLKSLLKGHGIENASMDFTQSIMNQVEAHTYHTTYKPIIAKKVWLIIISTTSIFALYLGFYEQIPKSPGGLTPYFIHIGNTLSATMTKVNSVPSLYLITIISLSTLLVTDYLLRIGGQRHET